MSIGWPGYLDSKKALGPLQMRMRMIRICMEGRTNDRTNENDSYSGLDDWICTDDIVTYCYN